MSPTELAALLLIQLLVILGVCRVVGALARRCGQPQVIGEMAAGILLGPSLLGQILPEWQAAIFPADSQPMMFCLSQLGLALYMFLVGLEFRNDLFQAQYGRAAAVSLTGILAPFALGAAAAMWLMQSEGLYFAPRVTTTQAILFLGSAMCITAFPVLARIIRERQLTGTSLGTLTLAAGAIDDVAAWSLLAVVLASNEGGGMSALGTVLGGAAYAAVTLGLVARWLKPMTLSVAHSGKLAGGQFAGLLMLLFAAAWLSDAIGIHAVFGAFILGCAVPRGRIVEELTHRLDSIVTTLLVPLFFAYSGLHTRLDLMTTPGLWLVAGVILAAACLGKFAACWAAARLTGADNSTALAVGALMNARGMMELILLNIGRDRGLITPELFSIMVVMTLVTTLMASPVVEWIYGRRLRADTDLEPATG